MPMDRSKYPANWNAIRAAVLEREDNRCLVCGAANHELIARSVDGAEYVTSMGDCMRAVVCANTGKYLRCECAERWLSERWRPLIKVILTIAHIDHDTTNNEPWNLAALCQRCHLRWDSELHAANARKTRKTKLAAAAVARSNLCEAVLRRTGDGGKIAQLIGERSSVQTARYVYAYLRNEVTSISAKESGGARYANAFKLGMVSAIGTRLIAQMKATDDGVDGETALVVVNREREAVAGYMSEHFSHVKDRHVRTRVSSPHAFGRGVARGREVALPGKAKHIASAPARIGRPA